MNRPEANRPPLNEALVSVVTPVYNEAGALSVLVSRLMATLAPLTRYEIIFVNDGSTDDSPLLLDGLAARHPEVRVLHLSRNFGHQAAAQAGLAHARGEVVVLMDSDLQDAPEAIREFLDQWQAGYDVVYALRQGRKEILPKRLLYAGFHRFMASIASTPIPAHAGLFGLLDRRVVKEILSLGERDRYLPGLRSWVGFKQIGVEVERLARYDDHPRISLRGLFRLAKTAIYSFSSFPLTLFTVIGWSALAIFVGLSGYSVFCKLFTDLAIPGWTSQVLSASFFGALNALGISMLGEYVIRIYDQVRQRPLYIVERETHFAAELGEIAVPSQVAKASLREWTSPGPLQPQNAFDDTLQDQSARS